MSINGFKQNLCIFIGVLTLALSAPLSAFALGKKHQSNQPNPFLDGKRVIAVGDVEKAVIELPNDSEYEFGTGYRETLRRILQDKTGHYVIVDKGIEKEESTLKSSSVDQPPEEVWSSTHLPTASFDVSVDALTFTSGAKGGRVFYGFDENFRTPFNDGKLKFKNEFPMRTVTFDPNWFDRTFDSKYRNLEDTTYGLDLGEGISIDLLFAWLKLKYVKYRSTLNLRIDIYAPFAARKETRLVQVKGDGFYYDLAGAYLNYSAGIRFARTDAMLQAVSRSLEGSLSVLDREFSTLPLTANVDFIDPKTGTLYLGSGKGAYVAAGVQYEVLDLPQTTVEVVRSVFSGALAKVVQGNLADIKPGMKLVQKKAVASVASQSLAAMANTPIEDKVNLPSQNLKKPSFPPGMIPKENFLAILWKSVVEIATLPLKVIAYNLFDQALYKEANVLRDPNQTQLNDPEQAWVKQIGLDTAPDVSGDPITVAVIDSGVDYNHPFIHSSVWINPNADTQRDKYGWDFISGDGRPFDDQIHGTQVASLILAVNPHVKILPIKVFNPWGITSSAAIYGAFQYALSKGAKVIVAAWATPRQSVALEQSIAECEQAGVLVVTSAGEGGYDLKSKARYPANLSKKYSHLITVASVDEKDELVSVPQRFSNFNEEIVTLAAPGQNLRVAEPRERIGKETSSSLSAAIVAGALSRKLMSNPTLTGLAAKESVLQDSDVVTALNGKVNRALRLRVR